MVKDLFAEGLSGAEIGNVINEFKRVQGLEGALNKIFPEAFGLWKELAGIENNFGPDEMRSVNFRIKHQTIVSILRLKYFAQEKFNRFNSM